MKEMKIGQTTEFEAYYTVRYPKEQDIYANVMKARRWIGEFYIIPYYDAKNRFRLAKGNTGRELWNDLVRLIRMFGYTTPESNPDVVLKETRFRRVSDFKDFPLTIPAYQGPLPIEEEEEKAEEDEDVLDEDADTMEADEGMGLLTKESTYSPHAVVYDDPSMIGSVSVPRKYSGGMAKEFIGVSGSPATVPKKYEGGLDKHYFDVQGIAGMQTGLGYRDSDVKVLAHEYTGKAKDGVSYRLIPFMDEDDIVRISRGPAEHPSVLYGDLYKSVEKFGYQGMLARKGHLTKKYDNVKYLGTKKVRLPAHVIPKKDEGGFLESFFSIFGLGEVDGLDGMNSRPLVIRMWTGYKFGTKVFVIGFYDRLENVRVAYHPRVGQVKRRFARMVRRFGITVSGKQTDDTLTTTTPSKREMERAKRLRRLTPLTNVKVHVPEKAVKGSELTMPDISKKPDVQRKRRRREQFTLYKQLNPMRSIPSKGGIFAVAYYSPKHKTNKWWRTPRPFMKPRRAIQQFNRFAHRHPEIRPPLSESNIDSVGRLQKVRRFKISY